MIKEFDVNGKLASFITQVSGDININNQADNEDLKSINNVIKFADKEYKPSQFSGHGRIYLRKNIIDNKNVLTQDMFSSQNTIYIIQYDYDLNSVEIAIPDNSTLCFDSGSLSNGTIKGSSTIILSNLSKIFTNISFSGSFNIKEWYPEWFGAKAEDSEYMSTSGIQNAVDAANSTNIKTVTLCGNKYYIDDTIQLYSFITLTGYSRNTKFYSSHNIFQKANKHAIQLSNGRQDYIRQVSIQNITLTNDYTGEDMSNHGIYIFNDTINTQCSHLYIENVFISYFCYGLFYNSYGDGGFGYNIIKRLYTTYNKIGIYLKGSLSTDTTITQYPWANHNTFKECIINSNSIGGIQITGFRSTQNIMFMQSTIEGNGLNYKYSDIEENTYAGFAFYGSNVNSFGYIRFKECYIENNYPRRKVSEGEADTTYEYTYSNYVYPLNYNIQACFVCNIQKIEVEKCMLSKYILLCYTKNSFGVNFHNNNYDLSKVAYKATDEKDIKYFFSFNVNNNNYAYSEIYIDEHFPRSSNTTNLFSEYDSVFYMDSSFDVLNMRGLNMYINHPLQDRVIEINSIKQKIKQGIIYLSNSGNGSNLGLSATNPAKSWGQIDMITNICYDKDYEVPIKIVDDYSYNSNIQNANYKLLNPLYVYCNTGVQWTLTGSKEFYGPVTFYNITFNLEGVNYSQYLRLYGNCNYKFIKCTFNLKSNAHYLLIGRKDTHIAFIDCTFNILDTSLGTNLYLYNPIQPNPIITFTNNVVQEGITIITNNQIAKSSLSSINKKLGEDFLVDGTNYATYDGTDVINPDGTLYSKVRRVKTASEISGGVANGRYKIISDIDLTDSSLTIPYNSILDFDGGRILNGTLNVNNATLLPYGMNLTKYVTSTISNRTNFAEGQIFYDSSIKSMKVWNGTNWVKPDGTVI